MFVEQMLASVPPVLPTAARVVLLILADMRGQNPEAWPSLGTIAGLAGCSESTVRRSVQELEKAGLIRIRRRFRDRGVQTSNGYEIACLAQGVTLEPYPSNLTGSGCQDDRVEGVTLEGGGCQVERGTSPSEHLHLNREDEESVVGLLLRGYEERYTARTNDMWQGHAAAQPHIAVVARWAERQAEHEGRPVAVVVEQWLESVFSRPGLVKAKWPWRKLSEDPARDYRAPAKAEEAGEDYSSRVRRIDEERQAWRDRTFGKAAAS